MYSFRETLQCSLYTAGIGKKHDIILDMKEIFLASSSPRRRELLQLCGYDFQCVPADIDETINMKGNLENEIVHLAECKADKILQSYPDGIVIGCDTIVVLNGIVMGKPHTAEKAIEMLQQLSGKTHTVITGTAICTKEKRYGDVSVNKVTFIKMKDEEINEYVKTGEPLDKAGAYGIQGIGARYIERIDGDYYAVMGLPVHKVYEQLRYYFC